jgi:dolichol-phosphate mannosyltransferase
MDLSLTVLIPIRNEQENIKIISDEILSKIFCKNFELLFINDFSEDNSENELKKLTEKYSQIKYINNEKKGLGGAISTGIHNSTGKFVCIMMSDSSDTVEDLNKYYEIISSDDLDAVFGSRFIQGGKIVEYPKLKYVLNRLGNLLAKLLLWTDLNDFTNGFKIYKKDTLLGLYPLVSEGFNIFFELPLKTIIRGYKYKIIPISYYNRTVGEAKFKIQELGSKYLFTLLYCFLEKILLNTKVK